MAAAAALAGNTTVIEDDGATLRFERSELGEGSIRNRRNRRNGETYGLVTPTQSVRLSHTYNIL